MISGVLRALGDSKTPLYFLIVSSVLNVILDMVFILKGQMGVAGAAYATIIAQGVAVVLCLIYMSKGYTILKIRKKDLTYSHTMALQLLKIGMPMALQFSITAIGTMVLQSAINQLGSLKVAAYTVSL